jgi:hypothetical protein
MGLYRFVDPETRTLKLSDGEVLIVKRRLNTGERRQAMQGDISETTLRIVLAYLLDWTLTDKQGLNIVPYAGKSDDERRSTLDALDPDDYDEIVELIAAHRAAERTARIAEKKMAGGTGSPAISGSPSVADGATSGSLSSTPTSTKSSLATC